MPFDLDPPFAWDGAGGVMTDVGKIVGLSNNVEQKVEGGLDAALAEIITSFDDASMVYIEGLSAAHEEYKKQTVAFRKSLLSVMEKRLTSPAIVVTTLGLPSYTNLSQILPRLREKMVADGKTIQRNVVTLGSVTAASGNVGNGTVIASKVLDGYSKPGDFFPADKNYNGLDSELCALAETLTVECTGDSQTSGRQEGGEAFKIYGNPPNPPDSTPTPYFGVETEGSGSSTDSAITGPHSGTLVSVPGFETWSADVPPVLSSWTLDTGTNNTHLIQESTAADVYRGTYAAKLVGDGALAAIQLSQTMAASKFKPLRRYLVSIRYKASAAVAAGTFGVEFNGTGYTPGGTEKVSIAPGSLATSWTLATFQINMPSVIPSDWKLVIKWTGTPTNAKNLWVDDIYVQPMTYFGGVAVAYVPGATRALRGDRWSFTVANDRAGKFQSVWARWFGRQLPSSGAPNIADSLAATTAFAP
jgi:hypothetical protein